MIDRDYIQQIVIQVLRSMHLPPLYVLKAPEDVDMERLQERWNVIDAAQGAAVPEGVREAAFLGVTQNVFVKAALGLSDEPACDILSRHLRQGTRVYMVPEKEFAWILDLQPRKHPNPEYAALFAGYKKSLERFGARVVPWTDLVTPMPNGPAVGTARAGVVNGKLLTEFDVKQCPDDVIYISPSTIVTPLARDAAKELGKRICVVGDGDEADERI